MKDRMFSVWFALCALLALAFWAVVIYVGLHFVVKTW